MDTIDTVKEMPIGTKEFELPSGKKVVIYPGKGFHSNRAMKECEGDTSRYIVCFMALLVEIDGKKVTSEDLEDLSSKEYMKLQTEFSEANF
jgi:tRNA splicing endonuclease